MEYIEREAFRREIDEHRPGRSYEDAWALTILDSLPAADVRPVVRCKDCRHRDPEDHKCDCGQLERAGCVFPVDDDYYCAYGEKREES